MTSHSVTEDWEITLPSYHKRLCDLAAVVAPPVQAVLETTLVLLLPKVPEDVTQCTLGTTNVTKQDSQLQHINGKSMGVNKGTHSETNT